MQVGALAFPLGGKLVLKLSPRDCSEFKLLILGTSCLSAKQSCAMDAQGSKLEALKGEVVAVVLWASCFFKAAEAAAAVLWASCFGQAELASYGLKLPKCCASSSFK